MYVNKDGRKKILKKRQDEFFKLKLPEIILEAKRLEISIEDIVSHIKKSRGRI